MHIFYKKVLIDVIINYVFRRKKLMKKKIILGSIISAETIALIVLIVLCAVGHFSKMPKLSNGQDKVVSLGTGTEYSVEQVYEMVKDSYALQKILDKIDGELLSNKYTNNEEVESYIATKVATAQANYPTEDKLNQYLSYFNCNSLDEYRDYLRLEKEKELITTEYAKTLVTDKEIKKYYKEDYVGDIAAKHILVKPQDSNTSEAKTKATELLDKIDNLVHEGKSVDEAFETVGNEAKDDNIIIYQDLSYFNKGAMVESFEDAAFKLKKGEYSSSPVYTQYGYHLIYVYDQKEKGKLEDAKETIIAQLAKDKVDEDKTVLQTKALDQLRKDNDFKLYDPSLEKQYGRYINYMINSK
jgi:parvulin-like peptidyl-prolyl isomerase